MKNLIIVAIFLSSIQSYAYFWHVIGANDEVKITQTGQAKIECITGNQVFKGYIQYQASGKGFENSSGEDGVTVGLKYHPDGPEFGFIISAKKITKTIICAKLHGKFQEVEQIKVNNLPELFYCGADSFIEILDESQYISLGIASYTRSVSEGFGGCGGGE